MNSLFPNDDAPTPQIQSRSPGHGTAQPAQLAVISSNKNLRFAFQAAFGTHDPLLVARPAATVLELLKETQKRATGFSFIVLQPPSTMPRKVKKALDEICRLFPGAKILIVTSAVGADRRATIVPPGQRPSAIAESVRISISSASYR